MRARAFQAHATCLTLVLSVFGPLAAEGQQRQTCVRIHQDHDDHQEVPGMLPGGITAGRHEEGSGMPTIIEPAQNGMVVHKAGASSEAIQSGWCVQQCQPACASVTTLNQKLAGLYSRVGRDGHCRLCIFAATWIVCLCRLSVIAVW